MSRIQKSPALLIMLVVLTAPCRLAAERVGDVPNPRSRDGNWVTDLPGELQPDTVARINALINQLEQDTTAEMAVVVIRSLEGMSIEDYANQLFNLWGIGKAEANNGLLFLWATGDRRVRIEVGTGLEAILPDSRAGQVLDSSVIPRFKQGDFDAGVLEGVGVLASLVRGESAELPPEAARLYSPEESSAPPQAAASPVPSGGWSPSPWLLAPGFGVLVAGLVGFRRWRRYRKRNCPSCSSLMNLVEEKADDSFLDKAGRLEEKLQSVDYDVWRCPSCGHHFTLRYPKWFTSYGKCPQCSNRTCSKTETTIQAATTHSSGRARVTEDCEFCTYRRHYTRTIPRKSSSSRSSFSSGSSFGGGSSSGGGASRGY